jgi:crotonobetainyl-CoA:carnitine CoA-transferase CaiB-like acyl-CoA transferase
MSRPLDGLRVLDLTRLLPGPFASLLLADLGATVLKVEDTQGGDYARYFPPLGGRMSAVFAALNRDKTGIALDLKQAAGREVLLRLVDRADVLLESFRPGVMDRLGLGADALAARNPRLVYCSISGYGQDSPPRPPRGPRLQLPGPRRARRGDGRRRSRRAAGDSGRGHRGGRALPRHRRPWRRSTSGRARASAAGSTPP